MHAMWENLYHYLFFEFSEYWNNEHFNFQNPFNQTLCLKNTFLTGKRPFSPLSSEKLTIMTMLVITVSCLCKAIIISKSL